MLGFHQLPACKLSGPRHGKENRLCLITRERMHRSLLFRVVRSKENGKNVVVIGDAEGRSAYVSKDPAVVAQLFRRKKLGRALRCGVPKDILDELMRKAVEWESLPACEKGLQYCEAYGLPGIFAAVDEIQTPYIDSYIWD